MSRMVILFVYLALIKVSRADIYEAVVGVDSLKITYENVIISIENYLRVEEKRLEIFKNLLNQFRVEQVNMGDMTHYVSNPMNFFKLIKKLTTDLDHLEYLTKTVTVFTKNASLVYPGGSDLQGAVEGIMRVQVVYALNITELANGTLSGTYSLGKEPFREHALPASTSDCYVIGLLLSTILAHRQAIEWLLEALSRYGNNDDEAVLSKPDKVQIIKLLRENYRKIDDIKNAHYWTEKLHEISKEIKDSADEVKLLEEFRMRLFLDSNIPWSADISEVPDKRKDLILTKYFYSHLCRGESVISEDLKKELLCYFLNGPNPFLRLAPIKAEQLLNDPQVMLYHEVLNDREIQIIQSSSLPTLRRAFVVDNDNPGNRIRSEARVTKTSWLGDDYVDVARISRRVADFTGLDMEFCEPLQVANYGIGGYYAQHHDYYIKGINETSGNRILTTLFYMSDVEQGGATVFPTLGVTVFPKKGTALTWWNLFPSGEPDARSLHAACPVMRGSKWVATKWLHERGQEFLRPCTP